MWGTVFFFFLFSPQGKIGVSSMVLVGQFFNSQVWRAGVILSLNSNLTTYDTASCAVYGTRVAFSSRRETDIEPAPCCTLYRAFLMPWS